jgi:phosphatidylserine decarboxylase
MTDILFIDRSSKKIRQERVYGGSFLNLLYGHGVLNKWISPFLRHVVAQWRWMSCLYGWLQKSRLTRYKIVPFIEKFSVDPQEFLEPVDSFNSFNEFFTRRLKESARPIALGNDIAILPADGRCLVFENIQNSDGFVIKGVKFDLDEFLIDVDLCNQYRHGAMAIIRLCPSDYHRFHFPCNCLPQAAKVIDGALYSVNPIALKKDISILTKNKREMTVLQTKSFGRVLYIEIGATCVGSIHQTFIPDEFYAKGDEKGYFSFGGSCIVLFFEPGRIQFDQDLLDASRKNMETRCLMGQSLGRSLIPF